MKTLTIIQPWATLIALGEKKIETRSWKTSYRGPLLIHAGKNITYAKHDLRYKKPFCDVIPQDYSLPLGKIIAKCNLVDCIKMVDWQLDTNLKVINATLENGQIITGNELEFGDYAPGRYAWILENVKILENPIEAKGQLSLWEFDYEKL